MKTILSVCLSLCLLCLLTAPSHANGRGGFAPGFRGGVGGVAAFRGGFVPGIRGAFAPGFVGGVRGINGNFFRSNYGYYGGRYFGANYGYNYGLPAAYLGASYYPGYTYPAYAGYGYSYNPSAYYSQALLSYLTGTAPAYEAPRAAYYQPSYSAQPTILTILVGALPNQGTGLPAAADPGYTAPAPRAMPYADPGVAPGATAAVGSVPLPALSTDTVAYLQPLSVRDQLAFLDRIYGRAHGLRLFNHHFGPRGISRVPGGGSGRIRPQTTHITDPSKRTNITTRTTIVPAPGVRESASQRAVERAARTAAGHHRK